MDKFCPYTGTACNSLCALNDDGKCIFIRMTKAVKDLELTLRDVGVKIDDAGSDISGVLRTFD